VIADNEISSCNVTADGPHTWSPVEISLTVPSTRRHLLVLLLGGNVVRANAVKAENEQQDTRNQHVMQSLHRTTQEWDKYLIVMYAMSNDVRGINVKLKDMSSYQAADSRK
jgi:hypothetical protein